MTVCIDDPSQETLKAMQPPTNWLCGFRWWREFIAATPDKRRAMLVGAFIATEAERTKRTIRKTSAIGYSTVFPETVSVPGLETDLDIARSTIQELQKRLDVKCREVERLRG